MNVVDRRRQRMLEARARGTHTAAEWRDLVARYGNRCAYCGEKARVGVDHIVPVSQGGGDSIDNVIPACWPCNTRKNATVGIVQPVITPRPAALRLSPEESRPVPEHDPLDDQLPTPFTWTASDRLFKAMTLRGWDQQDLIRETGLNKNTVSKVMPRKGDPVPDLSRLNEVTWRALANALGVRLDYLRNGG